MLEFECKKLSTNCNYASTGNSLEEVNKNAMKPAQTVQKDLLANMSPQKLVDMDKTLTRMTH
ncbi:MAG TPA: hypothetical protein VLD65_01970 [Anaerolineales bacterium]|nr:hypothetical protein [Anaerolineales bacterium]